MGVSGEIATLLDFHTTGRTIVAHCSHYYACLHDAPLRLELVAQRVGWDFNFYSGREYLAGRLYCSRCGWYYPTFALGHAGTRTGFAGTHSAGFEPLSSEAIRLLEVARQAAQADQVPWVGVRKGGRKFGR